MHNQLNDKQREIYEYIEKVLKENGYPPTVRDIQTALDIKSTSTVHYYLAQLEELGYIRREQGKSRAIRTQEAYGASSSSKTVKIPILGCVTAGMPILAEENLQGYIDFPLDRRVYQRNNLFALRIQGESMIEAGIMDGDIVIVDRTDYAENGDIVVALIGDEATVKTFYKEDGHFRLQPENSSMRAIITQNLYILGKVVACVRYY